jgi:hypothetical protein
MLRLRPLPLLAVAVALAPAPAAEPVPVAPPPRPVLDAGLDRKLADWTPRPATGPAEPWEKATDADWKDGRFRETDTGPFLNCTMEYPRDTGKERVFKATVVKLGDAAVVFDRGTMRLAAGWTGGWLNISDRRFGLLNTPTPKGTMAFALPPGPGWAASDGDWTVARNRFTHPLPKDWVKYRGLYVRGSRVVLSYTVDGTDVLESPGQETVEGTPLITRTIEVGPGEHPVRVMLGETRSGWGGGGQGDRAVAFSRIANNSYLVVGTAGDHTGFNRVSRGAETATYFLEFPPRKEARQVKVFLATAPMPAGASDFPAIRKHVESQQLPEPLTPLTRPGSGRWGKPIVTKLQRGKDDGPFAIDTLTLPYDNPHKALLFCTGLDFLPDGRVAVCTCHGDVWLATIGEAAGTVAWQRFATGLYQPLGLKVVDGKVVVLERGQLTRLHDLDGDGEADFYECLCNDWHTGGGEHSYDTCLETDPEGNFLFFKTGDTNTPHGGCLLRVSPDGGRVEVVATGFRHPIGLGVSPSGIVTGADQEGNWMPATRIDGYRKGGFYGDMRAHHRQTPPATYDPPICWVPREVDNSAGGQVWVPEGKWGPLGGLPLHLSYGRCKAFVLLRQELPDGTVQGGVADLGLTFLSGVCRGRFRPSDGHLYVCGLNGWQTAAKADGCVQRVRYTGKPFDLPVRLAVDGDTVRLTFSRPLDVRSAGPQRFRAAWWNYHWSGDYGSKRWKVSAPSQVGQDDVPVRGSELRDDGRTVVLRFDRLRPVMQMQVAYNVAAEGRPVVGSVFLTIHRTGK